MGSTLLEMEEWGGGATRIHEEGLGRNGGVLPTLSSPQRCMNPARHQLLFAVHSHESQFSSFASKRTTNTQALTLTLSGDESELPLTCALWCAEIPCVWGNRGAHGFSLSLSCNPPSVHARRVAGVPSVVAWRVVGSP